MGHCKVNKIVIDFKVDNIIEDFDIIKFSTSDKYIKHGAYILDQADGLLKAKSVVFEDGKSFYALYEKSVIKGLDLTSELNKIEGGDNFLYQKTDIAELVKSNRHIAGQLFLNSLSAPQHARLTFNNLTGRLFLFVESHFEYNSAAKGKKLFQIKAIEVHLTRDLILELNVRTFSSTLLRKKMDFTRRSFKEYPRYKLVSSTNTLRRVLSKDEKYGDDEFILKQISNGKDRKSVV